MSRHARVIVHDESSRLFLDAALQQSPPLHRPSLIVDQLGCRGQEKSVLEDSHPFRHLVQWLRLTPPKVAPFFTGSNTVVPNRQVLIDYLAASYSDSKPVPTPARSGDGTVRDQHQ
jgi:hypothetical protein